MQKRNNLLSPFKYLSGKFFSNNNKWDLIGYQFVTIVREVSEKELWIFTENRDQAFPSSLSVSLTAFDCNVNVRQNHGTYNVRFEKASRYRHAERERERERESLCLACSVSPGSTPRERINEGWTAIEVKEPRSWTEDRQTVSREVG